MMNIKNILISMITIAAVCSSYIQSSEFFIPTIEIYNKEQTDIRAAIINLDSGSIYTMVIPGGQAKKNYDFYIDSPLRIEIWKAATPNAAQAVFTINAPGKTKYLTWDAAKSPSLYPQTGPLLGLLGKTKSGLSLKNNVKSSDIKKETREQVSAGQMPTRIPQKPM